VAGAAVVLTMLPSGKHLLDAYRGTPGGHLAGCERAVPQRAEVRVVGGRRPKVFHLDANRAELDQYSMDWKRYLLQRETDEKRRKRERLNAERKADQLFTQAENVRAQATQATAAQNMAQRAQPPHPKSAPRPPHGPPGPLPCSPGA